MASEKIVDVRLFFSVPERGYIAQNESAVNLRNPEDRDILLVASYSFP